MAGDEDSLTLTHCRVTAALLILLLTSSAILCCIPFCNLFSCHGSEAILAWSWEEGEDNVLCSKDRLRDPDTSTPQREVGADAGFDGITDIRAVLIAPVLSGGSSGNRSCFTQHLTLPRTTGLCVVLLLLHTLNISGPA